MMSPRAYKLEVLFHDKFMDGDDSLAVDSEEIKIKETNERKVYLRTLDLCEGIPADDYLLHDDELHYLDCLISPMILPTCLKQNEMECFDGKDGVQMYFETHKMCEEDKVSGYKTASLFRAFIRRRLQRANNKLPEAKRSDQEFLESEAEKIMTDLKIDDKTSDVRSIFEYIRSRKYVVREEEFIEITEHFKLTRQCQPLYQEYVASCKRIKTYRWERREHFRVEDRNNALIRGGHATILYELRNKSVFKKLSFRKPKHL